MSKYLDHVTAVHMIETRNPGVVVPAIPQKAFDKANQISESMLAEGLHLVENQSHRLIAILTNPESEADSIVLGIEAVEDIYTIRKESTKARLGKLAIFTEALYKTCLLETPLGKLANCLSGPRS